MTDFAQRRTMMVDTQVRPSDVTKYPIIEAMLAIPREVYLPESSREAAYVGENLVVGAGRVMLEPRTLAKMLDALDIQAEERVLDIGCAMGYSTAVIARLAGSVVATEADDALATAARRTLSTEGVTNAVVRVAPLAEGAAADGPFDVITVQGAIERLPGTVAAQLKEGGRIGALFMEGALGTCRIGHKIDGVVTWRFAFHASAPVLAGYAARREFVL